MNRLFLRFCGIMTLGLLWAGCGHLAATPKADNSNKWFLDPSTEFANYKTYSFLQVTAVRYQDPILAKPAKKHFWQSEPKRPEIHHTDELIWRVLEGEMNAKGYSQVAQDKADIWIIYYGGPHSLTTNNPFGVKPHPFDTYFQTHEMTPDIFLVDVIDAKTHTLIYRGWDTTTFQKTLNPDAERVIDATEQTISFFPSRK